MFLVCIIGASEAFPLDLIPTKLFGFEQSNVIQHNGEMSGGESNHKQQVEMIPGGSVIGSLDRIDSVPANHQPVNFGQRYNYQQQQQNSANIMNNNEDFNDANPKFEASHERSYYSKQSSDGDVSSGQEVASNDGPQQNSASSPSDNNDNGRSATEESIEKIQSKVEDELKDVKGYKHYKEIASEPREDHEDEHHKHHEDHHEENHNEEPKKHEEHSHGHHQEESYKHPEPEKKHDHEEQHDSHEEHHGHHEEHHHAPEAFEVHHKKGGKSFQYFHQKHR